jgi:hypothetical protein
MQRKRLENSNRSLVNFYTVVIGAQLPDKLAWLIVLGCIRRTTIDYIWCRHLYFSK